MQAELMSCLRVCRLPACLLVIRGCFPAYADGNQTLATPYPWKQWPRLKVYTSPDLVHWTFRGDPLPMIPNTLWIPNVIYVEKTQTFVMWFGSGGWQTATSKDGIHFTPSGHGTMFSRFGAEARTDGTGFFVDDDGTGYIAFASMPRGFNHVVSIEKLSPDLLASTMVNVTGLFPDNFVESPSLFKRKGTYYLTYGSCCCGCQEGSGQAVFTAKAVVRMMIE
jgi:beta-xylosidase